MGVKSSKFKSKDSSDKRKSSQAADSTSDEDSGANLPNLEASRVSDISDRSRQQGSAQRTPSDTSSNSSNVGSFHPKKFSQRQDPIFSKSLSTEGMAELIRRESERTTPKELLQGSEALESLIEDSTGQMIAVQPPPFAQFSHKIHDGKWALNDCRKSSNKTIDVRSVDGHEMPITKVSIRPGSNQVVTACKSGEVNMFNAHSGGFLRTLGAPSRLPMCSVAFNCNGTLLATGSQDKILRLFDCSNFEEIASTSSHDSFVTCVTWANQNPIMLASGGGDKPIVRVSQLKVMDDGRRWVREKCVLIGHWAFVTSVQFSADDKSLVSASLDGTIRIWDVENGEPLVDMGFSANAQDRSKMHMPSLRHISHLHMEDELITDGSEQRFRWERDEFSAPMRLCKLQDYDGWGRQLEARFQFINVDNGEIVYTSSGWLRTLKGHQGPVNSVIWATKSATLISCGDDGTVRFWDAQNTVNTDMVLDDRFAEGTAGYSILSIEDEMTPGETDDSMHLETDEIIKLRIRFSERGFFFRQHCDVRHIPAKRIKRMQCSFSERMRNPVYRIEHEDGTLLFDWDSSLHVLEGHEGAVQSVALNPAETKVISASEDTTVRVWEMPKIVPGKRPEASCLFIISTTPTVPLSSVLVDSSSGVLICSGKQKGSLFFVSDDELKQALLN